MLQKTIGEALPIGDADGVDQAVSKALGASKAVLAELGDHRRALRSLTAWVAGRVPLIDEAQATGILRLGLQVMHTPGGAAPQTLAAVESIATSAVAAVIASNEVGLGRLETILRESRRPAVVRARAIVAEDAAIAALDRIAAEVRVFVGALQSTWWGREYLAAHPDDWSIVRSRDL